MTKSEKGYMGYGFLKKYWIKLNKMLLRNIGGILPQYDHPFGKVLGRTFRNFVARQIVEEFGNGIIVDRGANLQERVVLKDGCTVGINCLVGVEAVIGKNSKLAPDCMVYTRNKLFHKEEGKFYDYRPIQPVIIRDNCWIGARVIILPGVEIGESCVVGAGSVVTKSMPPFSVVAGNPAKVMKNLLEEENETGKINITM
ncbi:acyltransferase [Peribacillus muralis]|uniref:acyltransferase n=1 Tax=Peribacillus muralis TaxID=264697 RepID=UPI00070ACE51|nr:acyltransferase [Peribacillus muralis]